MTSPSTALTTAPAPIPQLSFTSTIGGYRYPNPSETISTASNAPSRPIIAFAWAPTPPPP